MSEYFKPLRRKIGMVMLLMAFLLAALYMLQLVSACGRAFIPDEEERLRGKITDRIVASAELAAIGLLTLTSAYLLISKPPNAKPAISDHLPNP